jgi:hypothetical protein
VFAIDLNLGSLCQTHSLVITDTFGVRVLIKPNSESGVPHSLWRMFQLSFTRGSGIGVPVSNTFFLPPTLVKSLHGRPIEEVLFLRDEMANLAWAVERQVESPSGAALNRFESYLELQRRAPQAAVPTPPPPGARRYLLSTEVPDYWTVRTEVENIKNGVRTPRTQQLDGQQALFQRLSEV